MKVLRTVAEVRAALDGQEDSHERLAALVARLDRMAAEVERVEDAVRQSAGLKLPSILWASA